MSKFQKLDRTGWEAEADSYNAKVNVAQNVLDGNPNTYWHSSYYSNGNFTGIDINPPKTWQNAPFNLWVDMKDIYFVDKVTILRRASQDELGAFNLYSSLDGETWDLINSYDIGNPSKILLVECDFEPIITRFLKVETTRSNRDTGNSFIAELEVYGIKSSEIEIENWQTINETFNTAMQADDECPTKKEIEAQDLLVNGNYLQNELPLFMDIEKATSEPTIANLWIKPGYMIEVDHSYKDKTYKMLEITDKGKELAMFPDVIDGEQYQIWNETFANSKIETLPEANYSNAISLDMFCYNAFRLRGTRQIKLGVCGSIAMAFQGCGGFRILLDNEGYMGDVEAKSAFQNSWIELGGGEFIGDFKGFIISDFIHGSYMCAESQLFIMREEYCFNLSNGYYESCFAGTQFRQLIGGSEVINELHNMNFLMPNAPLAFNTLKKVVNGAGKFDPQLFIDCLELEVCDIIELIHDLDLRESSKLSLASVEFIVDNKTNEEEINIIVHPEVYNNVSQELREKALTKQINIIQE